MSDKIVSSQANSYIGVLLPLCDSQYGYFNPSLLTADQVRSNLKCMLLTNRGERVMNGKIGSNYRQVLFNPGNAAETKQFIESDIRSNVNLYMPYVKIDKVDTTYNAASKAIEVSLRYTYNSEIFEELSFTILTSGAQTL